MREAIGALTMRGRVFAAAGATAIVCAILMALPSITSIGVLLLALPVASAILIGRSRYRLSLVRSVMPQLVSAGQSATVRLTLANEGRAPRGVLLLEDRLPFTLGPRPRFVLSGLGPDWRGEYSYPIRAEVRGRYEIGPMTVRVVDPFGMVDLGRTFASKIPITVTPRTVPLPHLPLGGAWTGSGDNRPRAFATGGAEDVTVREYRRGDDLRRVHWRSSARVGELMVRREEQPWQSRATVFIDNRVSAHRGQGAGSSLEPAVSAAASVGVHLTQRGFAVRLITASGGASAGSSGSWHTHQADHSAGPLLEELAVLGEEPGFRLDTSWLTESGSGGLIVAVLGSVDEHDLPVLRRMLNHAGAGVALCFDVDAWATPATTSSHALALLHSIGWRAVSLGPRDRLDLAWEELGRSAVRGTRNVQAPAHVPVAGGGA